MAEFWEQLLIAVPDELLCRTVDSSRRCPSGWQNFGSSCFSFSRESRSWGGARDACAKFGAHLVVLSSEKEQVFVMENLQGNNSYWLGVKIRHREGNWVWVNGEKPNFGFWDVWEKDPERSQKECGAMKPGGRWVNEKCSRELRWICEKPWDC
ncbi:C-type lectin domain family 17, member A-like [Malurus melanocephalus]|uniref:C-type lectin domain family 17, member A-like n=1 Tax=Malurus melanocephalus TaxID=175006 RepID=UPI002546A452|nr:C-type lectin domain family 17, member A-like [Malurus melanocephalus]